MSCGDISLTAGALDQYYAMRLNATTALYTLCVVGFIVCTGVLPSIAVANTLSTEQPSAPYEVVTVSGDPTQARTYLGALQGAPVMYEITAEQPFTLAATLEQPAWNRHEPAPYALIIIRQNDRGGGVSEVARLYSDEETQWQRVRDRAVGLTFYQATLSAPVGPGVYRIEVSTPENLGRYRLQLGTESDGVGYFARLGQIATTQDFFGYSPVKLLTSSYVYYPLAILLLIAGWRFAMKYRQVSRTA